MCWNGCNDLDFRKHKLFVVRQNRGAYSKSCDSCVTHSRNHELRAYSPALDKIENLNKSDKYMSHALFANQLKIFKFTSYLQK